MALVLRDRVKETTTTAGTGTITLAGAVSGFQSFAAIGNGNSTYYVITDPATGDWEVGVGTYTSSGTTLSRTTVLSSSNAGSLVSFGAGAKDVFVSYPSSRSVYQNENGTATVQNEFTTINADTINVSTANITAGTVSTTPTSGTDIANKTYVDTMVSSGITYHAPVRFEAPNALTATYNNGTAGVGATLTNAGTLTAFTPDGVVASLNDRVLIYQQANAIQNGVYTVTTVGSGSVPWVLTRATDANTYGVKSPNSLGEGDAFFVTSGNTGAGETYVCNTQGTITFGTTNITFVQVSSAQIYSAGTGLTLSGTQFSITNTGVSANTYGSASAVPVFAVNAQGQITSVTDTNIAISGSAVSGNISGQAGSVANALTAGTFLTSAGTYDGSAARTFSVDATSANTASKVVARDASGNFSAGTITATLNGSATSAGSATTVSGGAANQILYQSSANVTAFITAPTVSGQVLRWNGSAFDYAAGTISGVALGSNLNTLTFGTFLTGTSYNGSSAVTIATNATSANTASTLVARDASGNFSAGTITASLSGNATSANTATTSTNLAGGVAGAVPYQSGAGTTLFSAAGSSGQVLTSAGTSAPTWTTPATVNNGTLTMNVSGTGLSGSQTFTANQAGNATFTVTSNATNANTASTIVARDASGNFSAGTISAALSGNATTATTATQVSNSLTLATSGTGLSGSATFNGSSAQTFTVTSNATSANTASAIVARDASGNFSAGTITAALSGNASTATSAATWTTARTLTIGSTGKSVNGSADVSWSVAEVVGFTPVQQGGGTGQGTNKIYIGWLGSLLGLQVDTTNFGSVWPIAITGNAATATNASNTSSISNATSGDYTFTGTQTFNGTASKLAMVLNDAAETTTVSAIAATGTINFDVTTQSVLYYTSNASANWTLNVRASSGTTLNTIMSTGQSVTIAFIVTNGATAFRQTGFQIDGNAVTPRWQGGTAPAAGNASSLDAYVITIIKTGAATFTALESQTRFA